MNHSVSPALQPVNLSERIHILDILRGFAIFGILVVNIVGFAGPSYLPGYESSGELPWYDKIAEAAILYLADGKFFTIFSFLFGIGFSVQLSRAETKGREILAFYPRRLWALFGIGVLHALLFWYDDILRLYALLGFLLLVFRKRSNWTLLIWSGFFFVVNYILSLLSSPLESTMPNIAAIGRETYLHGSFLSVVQFQAWAGIYLFLEVLKVQSANVMALFLLGLLAGRVKFFEKLPENRALLQKILVVGLLVGMTFDIVHYFLEAPEVANLDFMLSALGLSAAYISALCLLSLSQRGAKLLAYLGQAGRMALTNYVLQSIICSFIFNGYGLGLYEKIGATGLLGLTIVIFVIQVLVSHWWLGRFRFGPLEWVWRSLTYKQKQPFRLGSS